MNQPLHIAIGLFVGDGLSAKRKKDFLVISAQKLVSENQIALATLADYKFSSDYAKKSENTLEIIKKIDKNFPEVMIIAPDVIDGKKLFLEFGGRPYYEKKEPVLMSSFIFSTSQDEREYLEKFSQPAT